MRPLAPAGVSGGFAGAALQLLKEAAFSDPAASYIEPFCDCPSGLRTKLGLLGVELDIHSLVLGVFLGFLLWPLVETLYLLRQLWAGYVRAQIGAWRPPRTPSYRVLG